MSSGPSKTLIERGIDWFRALTRPTSSGGSEREESPGSRPEPGERTTDVSETRTELGAPPDTDPTEAADTRRQRDPAGPTGASSNEFETDPSGGDLVDRDDVETAAEPSSIDQTDPDDAHLDRVSQPGTSDQDVLDDTVEADEDHADVYPADIRGEGDLADRESADVEGYAGGGTEELEQDGQSVEEPAESVDTESEDDAPLGC